MLLGRRAPAGKSSSAFHADGRVHDEERPEAHRPMPECNFVLAEILPRDVARLIGPYAAKPTAAAPIKLRSRGPLLCHLDADPPNPAVAFPSRRRADAGRNRKREKRTVRGGLREFAKRFLILLSIGCLISFVVFAARRGDGTGCDQKRTK